MHSRAPKPTKAENEKRAVRATADHTPVRRHQTPVPAMEAIQRSAGNAAAVAALHAVQRAPEGAQEARAGAIPSEAQDLMRKAGEGGVLVRSVQWNNLPYEFTSDDVRTPEASRGRNEAGQHGGLTKWSLLHQDLVPNFFKMHFDPETAAPPMSRFMGTMADPEAFMDGEGSRFLEISSNDRASNNFAPEGSESRSSGEAREELKRLLAEMKERQQGSPGERLDNTEIQTLGVPSGAVSGFLFSPNGQYANWAQARPTFQKVVDAVCASDAPKGLKGRDREHFKPSGRREFHVFTCEHGDTSRLTYLETLRPT
ncbi:hypothetical protein [Streptomyces sp. NPDC021212]|uniref:hypothetical protein n=1 Tax=Streptomyces sp. NPDC021212 TaxID=3365118 RepID=UPI0037993655